MGGAVPVTFSEDITWWLAKMRNAQERHILAQQRLQIALDLFGIHSHNRQVSGHVGAYCTSRATKGNYANPLNYCEPLNDRIVSRIDATCEGPQI
jgi:hypothetical protein